MADYPKRAESEMRNPQDEEAGNRRLTLSDWSDLSKEDIDLIVSLINNPPPESPAMQEAEKRYQSILQLD